ncbi:MAG: tRNA threonylcarbamoyladenosine dehydratase [Clostridia bacterium]
MNTRTINLIGEESFNKLQHSHVAVFGIGGVGSYSVEALARSGIGELSIIDNDIICESNINRQLYALYSTIGKDKVDVCKNRVLDINPNIIIHTYKVFVDESTINAIPFNTFDYVIDAIDTVKSKLLIIQTCKNNNIDIISSMGTGNKLDPSKFVITDIKKTHTCPLAKSIRKELDSNYNLKVLFSTELPIKPKQVLSENNKTSPSSISFVPSVAGLMLSAEVVRDIIKDSMINSK